MPGDERSGLRLVELAVCRPGTIASPVGATISDRLKISRQWSAPHELLAANRSRRHRTALSSMHRRLLCRQRGRRHQRTPVPAQPQPATRARLDDLAAGQADHCRESSGDRVVMHFDSAESQSGCLDSRGHFGFDRSNCPHRRAGRAPGRLSALAGDPFRARPRSCGGQPGSAATVGSRFASGPPAVA